VAEVVRRHPALGAATRLALRPAVWGARSIERTPGRVLILVIIVVGGGGLLGYGVARRRHPPP
jgi:hypothetical protein